MGEQKRKNKHLAEAKDEDAFATLRSTRDKTLPMPKLILHALQVNIAGGRLPPSKTTAGATSRSR